MEIIKNTNGKELTVALVGRLDTVTAPDLEANVNADLAGIDDLVLDFADLLYLAVH